MQSVRQSSCCKLSRSVGLDRGKANRTPVLGTMTDNLRDFAHHGLVPSGNRLDLIYDGLIEAANQRLTHRPTRYTLKQDMKRLHSALLD